jgi:hypothetical protein
MGGGVFLIGRRARRDLRNASCRSKSSVSNSKSSCRGKRRRMRSASGGRRSERSVGLRKTCRPGRGCPGRGGGDSPRNWLLVGRRPGQERRTPGRGRLLTLGCRFVRTRGRFFPRAVKLREEKGRQSPRSRERRRTEEEKTCESQDDLGVEGNLSSEGEEDTKVFVGLIGSGVDGSDVFASELYLILQQTMKVGSV